MLKNAKIYFIAPCYVYLMYISIIIQNNISIMENLINATIAHTNDQIANWYKNAKLDYGVIGEGRAFYNAKENEVKVNYIENGVNKTWSMAFYPEYLQNGINWIYNCWSELAN